MNRLRLHAAKMAGALLAFAVVTLTGAPAAAANSVTDWNARAQHAIADVAQELPWNQTRSFAMVSGAVYDAVNAIDATPYRPYLVAPAAQRSYSKDAAVATAAHDVLVGLFPAQRSSLDEQYDEALAAIPNNPDKAGAVAVGGQAADAMLAARQNDGVDASQTWIVGTQPGQWRPTPPFMIGISAQIGFMRTFAIPDADLFRSPSPNALTSAKYATDFNEVKSIGAASSTTRTSDQTQAAIFWGGLSNPWWSIFDQIALARHLSVSQTAPLWAGRLGRSARRWACHPQTQTVGRSTPRHPATQGERTLKRLIAGSRSQGPLTPALALLMVAVAPGDAQASASEASSLAS